MRLLAALVAVAALAGNAPAQIYKLEFKDQKAAKKLKQFCIEVNDELILVFEPKSGISFDDEKNSILYSPKTNEVWVADMDSPRVCPYKMEKGQKVKAVATKASVIVNGDDIKSIQFFMKDQTFWGLTKEYAKREDEVSDLRKQRDALKKGTPEWKLKQTAVVQTLDRLRSWLEETIYSKVARKVKKEIETEMKASKEANAQRLELAKQSIKVVPAPEDLARVGKEAFGDAVNLHVAESTHIRIVYREEAGDERVKGCLELAESIIDGFRVQFVDPFVGEDFKDYIPDDKMILEYFFAPSDVAQFEQFLGKYYGMKLDERTHGALEAKKISGVPFRRSAVPSQVDPTLTQDQSDLEGIVAHQLGHVLVNIHYNQDRTSDVPDWLPEGVGNWISLEYLGRNTVQCVSFDIGKYAKAAKGETDESNLRKGTADIYHRLALEEGLPIDQLVLRKLADFTDPDVAKSYSLFNFAVKTMSEKGQRWLRACCNAGAVPNELVKQWRKKSEDIFGLVGVDVFKKVNDDWIAYTRDLIGAPPQKK